MPLPTRLDNLITELLSKGNPQTLHFILAQHPVQQRNVISALTNLAKRAFVDLKEPKSHHGGGSGGRADWQSLSVKRMWVVCNFGSAANDDLMRQASVEVLCARTNEFCPHFRVIILLTSQSEFEGLPPICRTLSGKRPGFARVLHLGDSADANPLVIQDPNTGIASDCGMTVVEPSLEEWLDYTNVEDAAGDIATLQERIFNSDPDVTTVTYDPSCGRGGPYIRILRDALKFNIVVHTLDLTGSECGDVLGSCLISILYTSRKLKRLVLDSCSLTDVGVLHIAQALRANEFVKELTLSRNPSMTDASLLAIASIFTSGSKCTLEALDLSFNNIVYDVRFEWSPSALNCLWDALGQYGRLQKINLASCGLQRPHLVEAASRWLAAKEGACGKALTHVVLSHNYLGDEVITAVLKYLSGVSYLDLTHIQLGGCGFRAVGYALSEWRLPVQTLILDANNASLERPFDEDILGEAQITSTSLRESMSSILQPQESLSGPPSRGNHDEKEEEELGDPLVTMLKVVTDATIGGAFHVVQSLLNNHSLTSLSMSRSMIGDEAVTTLCDMIIGNLCGVVDVDISGNTNVEEASAHKIKELLVGGYFTAKDDDKDAATTPASKGDDSNMPSSNKSKKGVSPTNTATSSPTASASPVAATPVRGSAEKPLLRSLNISSNCTAIGERALLALYFNKGTRRLNLSNMALVDAMLLPLAEGIKQNPHLRLETLSIGRNQLWFDGVVNIAQLVMLSKTMRVLSLQQTWEAYDDEAGRPTTFSKSREEGLYYLSPLLDALRGGPAATPLGPRSPVKAAPTQSSLALMPTKLSATIPTLEVLDLRRNDITPKCAKGIAAAIADNHVIKAVLLDGNPLLTLAVLAEVGDSRLMTHTPDYLARMC